jgi:hypothetical protein
MVLGLRQINTCRKVPLQVIFLDVTFCIAFYERKGQNVKNNMFYTDSYIRINNLPGEKAGA